MFLFFFGGDLVSVCAVVVERAAYQHLLMFWKELLKVMNFTGECSHVRMRKKIVANKFIGITILPTLLQPRSKGERFCGSTFV